MTTVVFFIRAFRKWANVSPQFPVFCCSMIIYTGSFTLDLLYPFPNIHSLTYVTRRFPRLLLTSLRPVSVKFSKLAFLIIFPQNFCYLFLVVSNILILVLILLKPYFYSTFYIHDIFTIRR